MKNIKNLSQNLDYEPPYLDAAFYLKQHLRFDGDRYTITASEQVGDRLWRFTVRSSDKSEDRYLSSSNGIVKHEPSVT